MIVFEWFYEKAKIIEDELKRQEGYKVSAFFISYPYSHGCNV